MKNFTAKMTCSFHSGRRFSISIDDRSSGVHVCTIEMDPADFALMLAGHAFQNGDAKLVDCYDVVGKTKEMRTALIPREKWAHRRVSPEEVAELEAELLATAPEGEGWAVWCNGTRTQQNNPKHYHGTLYRYVETPETEDPNPHP